MVNGGARISGVRARNIGQVRLRLFSDIETSVAVRSETDLAI
ncbi:hypothetical protein HNQ71_005238 [Mesorhizobium sangaii]|uniref:Uncharacterized protein n=1 Tax=Mesorhizobium sangaii TaxID=505389 RepID=A0A841PIR9_9HYPH|nr:hypothetical protein [Mesorhizobium sangaii]